MTLMIRCQLKPGHSIKIRGDFFLIFESRCIGFVEKVTLDQLLLEEGKRLKTVAICIWIAFKRKNSLTKIRTVYRCFLGVYQFQMKDAGRVLYPEIPGRAKPPYLTDTFEPDFSPETLAPGRYNQ